MIRDDDLNCPVLFPSNEQSRKLSKKYGYNEWMISRFLNYIPDPENLLDYIDNKENLHTYIRTNTLKINPTILKKRLVSKGFQLKDTILDEVFEVLIPLSHYPTTRNSTQKNIPEIEDDKNRHCKPSLKVNEEEPKPNKLPSIGSTIEYLRGYYYIQDLSSCVAVNELDIPYADDLVVLDMAAAPGGKTTYIAQKLHNSGMIIACESNPKRLSSLIFNLSRCFVKNTMVFNMKSEEVQKLGIGFDRVLLDAPCTCEGIIQKDISRKKSRTLKDLEICSDRQKKMITAGFTVLKPGGLMVYSTCSFAPEENEMVIQYLVNNFKGARIEPIRFGSKGLTRFHKYEFIEQMNQTKRFYPHYHDTNGFFIAKIRKVFDTSAL